MKVFTEINDELDSYLKDKRTVITIGVFDGMHRGHEKVFSQVIKSAKDLNALSLCLTFDPHPALVLRPQNAPLMLSSIEQRIKYLEDFGFDIVLVMKFDEDLANLPADRFVKNILVDELHVKKIIVGEDFHFGSNRSGNIDSIAEFADQYDFEVSPISLLTQNRSDDLLISSTQIRRSIAGGEMAKVAEMLGRGYELTGVVVHGDKRGRKIGFPTANIEVAENMAVPADAVYAGYIFVDGIKYQTAINIGKRPTFNQQAVKSVVESHILDFDEDIYGKTVTLRFCSLVRSERRFSNVAELQNRLKVDVELVRKILSSSDC